MCTFCHQTIILHTLLQGGFISISITFVNHRLGVPACGRLPSESGATGGSTDNSADVPPPPGDQGPSPPLLFSVGVLLGPLCFASR